MPAIQRSEFALALNQVSNERGLNPDVVLETVKNAILAAYRKDHPGIEVEDYTASLDANTGEAKIFLKDKDVTPPGFGRIAAQTAKQVILQKIREKEKEAIISDFKLKLGTIANGMVLRFAGPNVIIDVGKTEAIMPPSEQIPNEKYHLNQRLVIYISEIKEGLKGEEVVVSRASNGLLEGLFKREVPEVSQGAVEIKAIEREPGNRSKVAVYSNQSGIDPVGSCVGQKGVRVQSIIQEFNGIEKIDIIQWQDNPKSYITQALSPAKEVKVEINEDEKVAHVFVAPEELSLAIGKEGQNVRLASKLTGYRIEIEGKDELSKLPKELLLAKATEEEVKEVKVKGKTKTLKGKKEKVQSQRISKEAEVKEETTEETVEKNLAAETKEILEAEKDVGQEKTAELGEREEQIAESVEVLKEEVSAKKNSEENKDKTSDQS